MAGRRENNCEGERRETNRFPIESELRYRLMADHPPQPGRGRTVNISSSGILFTVETPLAATHATCFSVTASSSGAKSMDTWPKNPPR